MCPIGEFFVADSYRPGQEEALQEVEQAFRDGYRYVLVEAPTGVGKSHIARAFAFQASSTHVITVQKVLQDQYARDFVGMAVMKGRGNYRCLGDDDCATGVCVRKHKRNPSCPYYRAIESAQAAQVVLHNFDSFYYQTTFGGRWFEKRELLIIDEAHNIESKYMVFISFSISNRYEPELTIPDYYTVQEYDSFLREHFEHLNRRLSDLDSRELSASEVREQTSCQQTAAKISTYLSTRADVEYVHEFEDVLGSHQRVTFRPVMVDYFVPPSLFAMGDNVLMLSATILDKEVFCRSVGLSPAEVYFMQVPSYFPAGNRPILKRYAGSMNYKTIGETLPLLVGRVEEILSMFPTKRGIIHTHSERVADYLKDHLPVDRLIHNNTFETPVEALAAHERISNGVLVASGMREGVDLSDELSRFQIICKIPYPSLGDKQVVRRMELDPDWYSYATSVMFVQAIGRSVRSAQDTAVTFVLDSGFDQFWNKCSHLIPEYVQQSLAGINSKGEVVLMPYSSPTGRTLGAFAL